MFAPPLGTSLAETQPSEQLLSMLEDLDNPSLAQHLAYLDLCIVAESNVDTWRRTAFFEETGETYKRINAACLGPLDNLTLRLAKGLEIFETKTGDFLKQQVQSQGMNKKIESISVKEIFRDIQVHIILDPLRFCSFVGTQKSTPEGLHVRKLYSSNLLNICRESSF